MYGMRESITILPRTNVTLYNTYTAFTNIKCMFAKVQCPANPSGGLQDSLMGYETQQEGCPEIKLKCTGPILRSSNRIYKLYISFFNLQRV